MNLRSDHRSSCAGAGRGLGKGQDESGQGNENGNEESHEAPLLGPPPPPPSLLMTHVEMLAARCELAHALEMPAQAIGSFAHGGHGGNGGNGGGTRGSKAWPCSYQDFLKTHPPMFTSTAEPLGA
jgi:hypothetical protein